MSIPSIPWYDRNPKTILKAYWANQVAPHGSTVRWTYTVPSDKRAFIEWAEVKIQRDTAGAPSNTASARIRYAVPNVREENMMLATLNRNDIALTKELVSIGQSILMNEGDVLTAHTWDVSAGGAIDYVIAVKITEFDRYVRNDVQTAGPRPDPVM